MIQDLDTTRFQGKLKSTNYVEDLVDAYYITDDLFPGGTVDGEVVPGLGKRQSALNKEFKEDIETLQEQTADKLGDVVFSTTKNQSSVELGRINAEDDTFRIEAGSGIKVDKWSVDPEANAAQISVDTDVLATKTDLTAKYEKPSGGIPKTDLSSDVQASLNKADTALQNHQDISGKADKADTYTKAQTYSKTEVDAAIEAIDVSEQLAYYALKTEVTSAVADETTRAQGVEATKANTVDVNAALGNKQDTIQDLNTIRNGASLGATAQQPTTTLAGYGITDGYTKAEGQALETQVTNAIDSVQDAVNQLNGNEVVVVADHTAVTNPDGQKIYREQGSNSYTDWMYQDSSWKEIATYNMPGFDNVPTKNSNKIVESGGVFKAIQDDAVFDVSAHNLDLNQNPTPYESLALALAAIPADYKKGGMSIKFIKQDVTVSYSVANGTSQGASLDAVTVSNQFTLANGSSYSANDILAAIEDDTDKAAVETAINGLSNNGDIIVIQYVLDGTNYAIWTITKNVNTKNEYVQYRFLGATTDGFTNVANWQGVKNEPVAGNNDLYISGAAKNTETYNELAIYDSFQYDESKLIPFCINSSNKWQNQGYHVLIPLNDEKEITILRNKRACIFAFLKSYSFNLRNGDDVDFSDTYTSRIAFNNDNFSATYTIPSDAKYICFSIATEEKELCFPYVVFSKKTLSDINKEAISKEGDFNKIPLGNDDAANPAFTINDYNKWTSTSGATTKIWEIDGIANRKIRLVNTRDSAIILYFLTKEYSTPTAGAYIPICANTTRVSVAVGDDVIMDVPYDCKYIYVSKLTPVYVLQNTKTSLENLNEAIKSEVAIDYLDYVDYRIPWVLNYSSGGRWRNEGRSYTIPVKANSTIKMTAAVGRSVYAFLRTNLPISDTLGDFVTGTSLTRITSGTTITVTSPNVDCYLYVTDLPTASSQESDSMLPVTTMNALLPKSTFKSIKALEERINSLETVDNYNLSKFGVGKDNEIWITSWFNPQVIETSKYRKKLIWGWCDDIGCTGVSEFDPQTKLVKRTVLKQIAEADDHNSCFVIELQDGRIGVGYHGNHMGNNAELNNYLYIRVSNTRDLVDGFGDVIRIHGTMRMNYGQCFYLNGKYYLFFRYGTPYWGYVVSDDFVNWSEPKAIFSTQNQFYIRFTKVSDNANVVRLCLYEHPDYRSDIKMGFFDAETGNILNSDSNHTVLGNIEDESPITFSSFNTIVSVAENKKIRLYEAAVTNMDTSIIAISDFTSAQNSSEYYIARNGVREFVAAGGKDLIVNDYPLGFTIIDGNNVVVCRGASDGKDYVEIMTYSNNAWSLTKTVYSENRNGVIDVNNNRNTRPIVSDKGHYILWQRGYYSFYSDGRYSTDAMIYDIVNDNIY